MKVIVDIGRPQHPGRTGFGLHGRMVVSLYPAFRHLLFEGRGRVPTRCRPALGRVSGIAVYLRGGIHDGHAWRRKIKFGHPISPLKNYVGLAMTFWWGKGRRSRSVIRSCGVKGMISPRERSSKRMAGTAANKGKADADPKGLGMARGFHTSGRRPLPERRLIISAVYQDQRRWSVDVPYRPHGPWAGGERWIPSQNSAERIGVPVSQWEFPRSTRAPPFIDVATHATRGVYWRGRSRSQGGRKLAKGEGSWRLASRILTRPVMP